MHEGRKDQEKQPVRCLDCREKVVISEHTRGEGSITQRGKGGDHTRVMGAQT